MLALVEMLKTCNPPPIIVQSISFNFDDLTDEACVVLLGFAHQCPSLTTLELFGNRIGVLLQHAPCTAVGVCVVARSSWRVIRWEFELLAASCILHAGDGSCRALASLLKQGNLQRLKLGDNSIEDSGASFLSSGLKDNTSLVQLHLGSNCIGDAGVTAIGAMRITLPCAAAVLVVLVSGSEGTNFHRSEVTSAFRATADKRDNQHQVEFHPLCKTRCAVVRLRNRA